MIGAFLALGLLLAPVPAEAAPAVRGPCAGEACIWFRETGRRLAGSSPRGTLLRLRVRWWESKHPQGRNATGQRTETVYARCSVSVPALVERRGAVWWERPIDPVAQALAGADRASVNLAALVALYAWACHGIRPGDAAPPGLAALYPARTMAGEREARPLNQPEDALQ